MTDTSATLLVIFGATGDLAQRMLWPSLYALHRDGLLHPRLRLLGTARSELDPAAFRDVVAASLERAHPAAGADAEARAAFLARVHYQPAAIDDPAQARALTDAIAALRDGDIVYHLSPAPRFDGAICELLGAAGLAGAGTRVLLEKPIGHDLASSIAVNQAVGGVFDEARVFRLDHYLGKEGVQNLLALRFGNAMFEPLWNARHIQQVQITAAETIGVEGRGDYYDTSGATRDMLQNHMLQLLALTAMEPPSHFEPEAVRNEKIKVLRSLRPLRGADAVANAVGGQYAAGAIGGAAVPGYADELGRASRTETFVAVRAQIDNWRWSGVPFYLRTGKRMPRRCTEIFIQFRALPYSIFGEGAGAQPNALVIRLQPEERIELSLMSKTPGLDVGGVKLSQVALDLDLHDAHGEQRRRSAYERLYLDALEARGTLFVRRDEVEAAWGWVDDIHRGWEAAGVTPKAYPAGTWGPASALTLAERHGHAWRE